jgi:hypothetical protein
MSTFLGLICCSAHQSITDEGLFSLYSYFKKALRKADGLVSVLEQRDTLLNQA